MLGSTDTKHSKCNHRQHLPYHNSWPVVSSRCNLYVFLAIYRAQANNKNAGADVDPGIWAMVENCIGIVSACLPTLRPIYNLVARGSYPSKRFRPDERPEPSRKTCVSVHGRFSTHALPQRNAILMLNSTIGHHCSVSSCSRCQNSRTSNSGTSNRKKIPGFQGSWPGSKKNNSAPGMPSRDSYFDLESQGSAVKNQPQIELRSLEDRTSVRSPQPTVECFR